MRKVHCALIAVAIAGSVAATFPYAAALLGAERPSSEWTVLPYHLTARPWKPVNMPREKYLEIVEGVCRFTIQHQNDTGAIIDPFIKREHQYATPYFAHAVGALVHEGRALDLLPYGVKAMEHATTSFGNGKAAVPDNHGEFFMAALTGALPLYEKHVPPADLAKWRERMKKPRAEVIRGHTNNWETYVMKGEWMRFKAGLVSREDAVTAVETAWNERHRARIAAPPFFLYHDRSSDPDTLSVEAVGRGNMLALIHLGYDGPSAPEIRKAVETATRNTLMLQDPTGQTPTNGRTDDHVWVDVGYQLGFEVMAERARVAGDLESAGQFRHAAMLALQNILRWRRTDGPWAGSFYVTKNHFDPALRVGHQAASEYTNYGGSLMFHLAEAYHARKHEIPERPSPSEIGGYALELDREFSTAIANAGGMQLQVNLRGQLEETHTKRWTPLGVVRLARVGWETRLGPSDGVSTNEGGVSLAPTFMEGGRWLRLADLPERYEGKWAVDFVHPLLVRCSVTYAPKAGKSGPAFVNEFVITPDGILSTTRKTSNDSTDWGVTWPLIENDGRPLKPTVTSHSASVSYPGGGDEQNFLALHANARIVAEDRTFRSTFGDLRAVRVIASEAANRSFIYPRSATDPSGADVRNTFIVTAEGFVSKLARVKGDTYVGRTSAGGVAKALDLDSDGKADVVFDKECGFVIQLRNGKPTYVEVDRNVSGTIGGRKLTLRAYKPLDLN
jgi:hypothetical protein